MRGIMRGVCVCTGIYNISLLVVRLERRCGTEHAMLPTSREDLISLAHRRNPFSNDFMKERTRL
jgi:hypothetical protein